MKMMILVEMDESEHSSYELRQIIVNHIIG